MTSRRNFLYRAGSGLSSVALSSLLYQDQVRAGVLAWVLTALLPSGFLIASEAMPSGLVMIGIAVGLVQYVAAGLVAGVLYREGAETPVKSSAMAA